MADLRVHSNTSNLIRFRLMNSSTGQGLTGLTEASSGLIISTITDNEAAATTYTAAGSTIETIVTLGTFAAPTATKCRFKEVDAVNHKGLYEFQFADARFSVANARRLVISVTGAANLLDGAYEIQLTQFNPYDSVRLGLTALPNAAAEAAGGLYTRGSGAGQINQAANGMIDTNSVRLNNVSQSLLDLKDFADDGYDPSTNKVQGVVLADALTTNNDKTGYSLSTAGVQAIWDALASALTTAGSIGKLLVDNINATISSRSTLTQADIRTAIGMASANLDTQLGSIAGGLVNVVTVTDKLDTTLELDGLVYRFTANALEEAPSGGGGGTGLINFVYGGKWNLSQQNRITFYLQDSSRNPVTGLGSTFTLQLAKNNGSFAASTGTKAEIGNGWYTYLATANEANTVGTVSVQISGTDVVDQNLEYVVTERTSAAISFTYTVTREDTGAPVPGATVWVTTDIGGTNVIWSGSTDLSGIARDSNSMLPRLDAGTYYFWKFKANWIDTQDPDTEVVS